MEFVFGGCRHATNFCRSKVSAHYQRGPSKRLCGQVKDHVPHGVDKTKLNCVAHIRLQEMVALLLPFLRRGNVFPLVFGGIEGLDGGADLGVRLEGDEGGSEESGGGSS